MVKVDKGMVGCSLRKPDGRMRASCCESANSQTKNVQRGSICSSLFCELFLSCIIYSETPQEIQNLISRRVVPYISGSYLHQPAAAISYHHYHELEMIARIYPRVSGG